MNYARKIVTIPADQCVNESLENQFVQKNNYEDFYNQN